MVYNDDKEYVCPEGTQSCNNMLTVNDTICVEDLSECPIISMGFDTTATESNIQYYESKGFTVIEFIDRDPYSSS